MPSKLTATPPSWVLSKGHIFSKAAVLCSCWHQPSPTKTNFSLPFDRPACVPGPVSVCRNVSVPRCLFVFDYNNFRESVSLDLLDCIANSPWGRYLSRCGSKCPKITQKKFLETFGGMAWFVGLMQFSLSVLLLWNIGSCPFSRRNSPRFVILCSHKAVGAGNLGENLIHWWFKKKVGMTAWDPLFSFVGICQMFGKCAITFPTACQNCAGYYSQKYVTKFRSSLDLAKAIPGTTSFLIKMTCSVNSNNRAIHFQPTS